MREGFVYRISFKMLPVHVCCIPNKLLLRKETDIIHLAIGVKEVLHMLEGSKHLPACKGGKSLMTKISIAQPLTKVFMSTPWIKRSLCICRCGCVCVGGVYLGVWVWVWGLCWGVCGGCACGGSVWVWCVGCVFVCLFVCLFFGMCH